MRSLITILITAFFGISMPTEGQSRRVPPAQTIEKATDRQFPARPTPTPTPDATDENEEVYSVSTRLVTIPVRVLDRRNRFIGGLTRSSFTIFEDNVPQELAYFTNEAQPFTVALVLDMSYSAAFKIDEIQNAAIAFIDQLRPDDQVMVISFDEDVHMLCEATSDRKRIYSAIQSTRIATGTSLYEAVDRTMNARLRSIKGRKAIVLFTDGVDTTSRSAHDLDNLRDSMELDALIYPIRYDTFADVQAMSRGGVIIRSDGSGVPAVTLPAGSPLPDSSRRRTGGSGDVNTVPPGLPPSRPPIRTPSERGTTAEEYAYAEYYLDQLAVRTGGQVYMASDRRSLSSGFARIASELREYYSIGYYPQEAPVPGRSRRIKVRVDRPNVVVKARDTFVDSNN